MSNQSQDPRHQEVIELLKTSQLEGSDLEMPPKCFLTMDGEFLDYEEGEALRARFPVKEAYRNPLGYMQGGFLVAAMDNTLGPLSYLVAPPSVTSQLNTSFIRPVTPDLDYVYVEARVVERTRKQIFITTHARDSRGKLLAICHANCVLL
jgi:uncharacterized protein (TIGR00369 family)